MKSIELGQTGKDIITGFTGVCIGKVQYLTGCNQVALLPAKLSKDGNRMNAEYFDESRIMVTNAKTIKLIGNLAIENPGRDEAPPRIR